MRTEVLNLEETRSELDGFAYRVTLELGGQKKTHTLTIGRPDYERLRADEDERPADFARRVMDVFLDAETGRG